MKLITKPEHGSLAWLERRWKDDEGKCTFGASEAPILAGVSPYATIADLFIIKKLNPVPSENKMAFRRGNLLEPVLLEEAGRMLNLPITTPEYMYQNGRFTVSLDGVDNAEDPKLIVEAKTTARYRVQSSEDLPREWLWQGWAQQFVTGAEVKFMVLDSDQSLSLLDLPANNQAADFLADYSERLGQLIDSNEEPNAELFEQFTAEQVSSIFKPEATSIELGEEGLEWIEMYQEAKQTYEDAEIMVNLAKDAIARLLRENEIGLVNGVKAVTWKEQAGRKSFDSKAFKEDNPTLFENYSKVGAPFRTMRFSKGK
jgi:predicted phage-related endonuclease